MTEWRKSSRCSFGSCVEVAHRGDGVVIVRSSTDTLRVVRFTAQEWAVFLEAAKAGEFDGEALS